MDIYKSQQLFNQFELKIRQRSLRMKNLCCGAKIGKKRYQETIADIKARVSTTRRLKMNDDQIYEFTERFESMAVNQQMSLKNYKESLGLIGTDSLSFMADRMFAVMDLDHSGFITLDEYLCYIDIMLHGTQEEKRKQSFGLLDKRGLGDITFDDFKSIVQSFAQMWSAALGTPVPLNLRYFQQIFNEMACGKPYFNLQDFDRYMQQNPDALTWFSKPEIAMQQRVNDYKNKKQKEKQVLIDQIADLKDKVDSHLISFQEVLCSSLDVLDQRYKGNAKNILLVPEGLTPLQPSLDMIGETPNPADEDTSRHLASSSVNHLLISSSAKKPSVFRVDDNQDARLRVNEQGVGEKDGRSRSAEEEKLLHREEVEAPLSLRRLGKMQKVVQARGEHNQEGWIERKIEELQQRTQPANEPKATASSLIFTGQLAAVKVEFPRVPRLELKQKATHAGDQDGARTMMSAEGGQSRNATSNHARTFYRSSHRHDNIVSRSDNGGALDDRRALLANRSQVFSRDQQAALVDGSRNSQVQMAKTMKHERDFVSGFADQVAISGRNNFMANENEGLEARLASPSEVSLKGHALQKQLRQCQNEPLDKNYSTLSADQQAELLLSGKQLTKERKMLSEFDRASSKEEDLYEGGSKEEVPSEIRQDSQDDSVGMEFENIRAEAEAEHRDFENPYERSLQNNSEANPRLTFGNRKENLAEQHSEADSLQKPRAQTVTHGTGDHNLSQLVQPTLKRNLNSIHKQDQELPGNFYYLKSFDESQAPDEALEVRSEHTAEQPLNAFHQGVIIRGQHSEFDENPSEDDQEQEPMGGAFAGLRGKSLIQRYKRLEQLMKKKKMLTQIENYRLDDSEQVKNQYEKGEGGKSEAAEVKRKSNVQHNIVEVDSQDRFNQSKAHLNEDSDTLSRNAEQPFDVADSAQLIKVVHPNSSGLQNPSTSKQEVAMSSQESFQCEAASEQVASDMDKGAQGHAGKSPKQSNFASMFGRPFSSFLHMGASQQKSFKQVDAGSQSLCTDQRSQQLVVPEKPQVGDMTSPEQVKIKFDQSKESADWLLLRKKAKNIEKSEENVVYERHSTGEDAKPQQGSMLKRIEELEVELALAKERLMIGSQIIRSLVTDTQDSLKYFRQSFDLVTQTSTAQYKGNRVKQAVLRQGQQQMHERVTQNVHKKVPKLISKNPQRSKTMVPRQTASSKEPQIEEEKGQGEEPITSERLIIKDPLSISTREPSKSMVEKVSTRNFVHPAHHNFNMVFNIMLGIKMSVDATLDLPMYTPTEKDYAIRCEFQVAPYKTENSDLVKACSFFDYAPKIFASIRKQSGISKEKYLESLGPEKILGYIFKSDFQTLSELCSSGKSGSFFYYSYDGLFMLKTIPRHEFKKLKAMLKNYHVYLTETNQESMICRVFGLHKVIFFRKRGKTKQKIYFCVMNNVFQTSKKIDLRYDLKGSTYGRQTIKEKGGVKVDRTVALKDLDFLNKKEEFKVGHEKKQRLMQILRMDAAFFADNNIIDYSLLVGVHNRSEHPSTFLSRRDSLGDERLQVDVAGTPAEAASPLGTLGAFDGLSSSNLDDSICQQFYQQYDGGMLSLDKQHIYFMGVIDIFTGYTFNKKVEHFGKSIYQNGSTISCVPPQRYAERFCQFLNRAFR